MTWVHFQRYIVGQMNSTKFPRIQGFLYSITLLAACGQSPGNIPTTNNDAGTKTQTSKDAAQGSAVMMDATVKQGTENCTIWDDMSRDPPLPKKQRYSSVWILILILRVGEESTGERLR